MAVPFSVCTKVERRAEIRFLFEEECQLDGLEVASPVRKPRYRDRSQLKSIDFLDKKIVGTYLMLHIDDIDETKFLHLLKLIDIRTKTKLSEGKVNGVSRSTVPISDFVTLGDEVHDSRCSRQVPKSRGHEIVVNVDANKERRLYPDSTKDPLCGWLKVLTLARCESLDSVVLTQVETWLQKTSGDLDKDSKATNPMPRYVDIPQDDFIRYNLD
ncbi:hypothetical protein TNCV_2683091 [Trichonephila clavipes]|nr:hypothetical protein TNCV_2683091 [Trichonephila clavipes]